MTSLERRIEKLEPKDTGIPRTHVVTIFDSAVSEEQALEREPAPESSETLIIHFETVTKKGEIL